MADIQRGSGKTKGQMKYADGGAYFVWCDGVLSYPKELAKSLDRKDLQIISLKQYQNGVTRGTVRQIVFNHTLKLPLSA